MFTGIVEDLGFVDSLVKTGITAKMRIKTQMPLDEVKLGDSVAVNGACLTLTRISPPFFEVDISFETLERTALNKSRRGDRVNLERATRLSDRLDGHIVSGHIDGVGVIKEKSILQNMMVLSVQIGEKNANLCVTKGSVAIDGISLTINTLDKDSVTLTIIPHTAKLTTLGFKETGDIVNIETDIIGKYIHRFLDRSVSAESKTESTVVDFEYLAANGFH